MLSTVLVVLQCGAQAGSSKARAVKSTRAKNSKVQEIEGRRRATTRTRVGERAGKLHTADFNFNLAVITSRALNFTVSFVFF